MVKKCDLNWVDDVRLGSAEQMMEVRGSTDKYRSLKGVKSGFFR